MPFHFSPIHFLHYFLKREASQLFASIAIRYLALGMILIFEPIYIFLYFGKSLPLTILFFGAIHGGYGLLAVYGGKIMSKVGLKHAMLFSHLFFFGYYLSLFFLYRSILLLPLAILLRVWGMTLFWPAFHTDFIRFSEKDHRALEVGKLNLACSIPCIISPAIGGTILASFGYPTLFTVVLLVLLASAIPLFLSREVHEIYTDSYQQAWQRIFKKENLGNSLAFLAQGFDLHASLYLWPIFMAVLAIQYPSMGGIVTFALGVSALFALYMGRIADTFNRARLLKIGAVLTSLAWVLKYFVSNAFEAFLAHIFHRLSRTSLGIPYQTIFYEKAALKGPESDEFLIYRETLLNSGRMFFSLILALIFVFLPKVNLAFFLAALASLGMAWIGKKT